MLVLFTVERGWPIIGFALGGFLLSLAYTAPPLRLKKRGLGEPTVIVVWGPLMVGGTYYAATGSIPGAVLLASLPYAILSTTVLMGKHIDKIAWDAAGRHPHAARDARRGARPRGDARRCSCLLPVGDRARRSRACCRSARCSSLLSLPIAAPGRGARSVSRSPPSRRCRTRCGRCGSRRTRSSSPAAPAACSCSG